jgi:hypothetical protein
MKTATRKLPKTEADGTKVVDLQAWQRDAFGAFRRGEITRDELERTIRNLQNRVFALYA